MQFISYLSGNGEDNGGEFTFWPKGPNGQIKSQRPIRNSAIITDGVHIAHGVSQWNPRHENLSPPTLRKDDNNDIRYIGDNNWQLFVNDKPNKM